MTLQELFNLIKNNEIEKLRAELERQKQLRASGQRVTDILSLRKSQTGANALLKAAFEGKLEIFDLFVEYGADLNAVDNDGFNALQYVVFFGYLPMLERLVDHYHMDLSVVREDGKNLVHLAAEGGSITILECLIKKYHLDIFSVDTMERNALFYAVVGDQLQMFKYLIKEYQFNPDKCASEDDPSTLYFVMMRNSRKILSHLITYHKEYNLDVSAERLLFLLTCSTHAFLVFKYLIEAHQIDFDFITNEGCNPLHIVAIGNSVELIEHFIDVCKYDIHAVTWTNTALFRAAIYNDQPIVKKLLYFGAGIGIMNLPGGIDYSQQILIGAKYPGQPVTPQTHPTAITTIAQFEASQILNPSTPKHLLQLLRACFTAHHQSNEVMQLQFALLREFKKRISAATFTEAVFLELMPDLEIVINHYKKLSSFLELSHSKIKIKGEIRPPCELPAAKLLVEISYALAKLSLVTAFAIQIVSQSCYPLETLETPKGKCLPPELKKKVSPPIEFFRLIPVSFWQHAKTAKQDHLPLESYRAPSCALQ